MISPIQRDLQDYKDWIDLFRRADSIEWLFTSARAVGVWSQIGEIS